MTLPSSPARPRRIVLPAALAAIVLPAAVAAALLAGTECTRSSSGASGGSGAEGAVAFASLSYDGALAQAKSDRKLVMLDVYTDWCGWCKKLDRDVYSDSRVAAALKDVIPVKVNAEKGGEDVARRYAVEGFPTILFVDANGQVVKRIDGYVDADEMLRTIQALPRARA